MGPPTPTFGAVTAVTAPPKSLALSPRRIEPSTAATSKAPPVTIPAAVWLTLPFLAMTVSVPVPVLTAPSTIPLASASTAAPVPTVVRFTVFPKSLALSPRVTPPEPPSNVAAPVTASGWFWVMPTAVTSSVPVVEIAPSRMAVLSTSVMAKPPVFVAETALVNSLSESLIVTTPAPPSKLDVPPTVSGPDCVMPRARIARSPVRLKASSVSG